MSFPPLRVTEEELAVLIELSDREHVLQLDWGTGDVPYVPGNRWALDLLLSGHLDEVEEKLRRGE